MQKKFIQTGKADGLHILQFEDGSIAKVTDDELHRLKTGLPKSDKEALKAAGEEIKALKGQVKTLETQVEQLTGQKNVAETTNEELTRKFQEVETDRDEWKKKAEDLAKEVKALKSNAPKDSGPATPNPEGKDVKGAPETKDVKGPEGTK